ncbi:glutaredoxin-like protein NrdH [Curtobacterium poinsettiae]|uniref:glutaredoxin-like protein NrdH n=1 Tax=Curtobacterium poinsettiae TaxID=159612 RepID=UPI001BDE27CD|nr:glutaredoxin-like protein NrdH [Curtobacterium flaccumfaciens]MBT1611895.1 glutaredoxin-like protein NrdH [Curtobacterium flaccumfaciens pv. poinsettiae]
MITVYGKPSCVQCNATYRALDNAGVPYEVVDVTISAAAYEYVSDDLGCSQAPVVVVDEHDHWSGFQPDEIRRVAARLNPAASH